MTPRYSEKNRDQALEKTRQRLISAALKEISRTGYDGANINSISLAAGYAKGTIYNYFTSKKELMFAILEEAGTTHYDFIARHIREVDDPIQRVERFFEAGFSFVESDPPRGQVLVSTLYGTNVEFKSRLYEIYQPMFQLVEQEILAPGMAEGIFRQVDPTDTSIMIMTFYLGTASSVDQSGKPFLDPARVSNFVLSAICQDM